MGIVVAYLRGGSGRANPLAQTPIFGCRKQPGFVREPSSEGPLHRRKHYGDEFDREKLAREVDSASNPDPDSYFWFGTE